MEKNTPTHSLQCRLCKEHSPEELISLVSNWSNSVHYTRLCLPCFIGQSIYRTCAYLGENGCLFFYFLYYSVVIWVQIRMDLTNYIHFCVPCCTVSLIRSHSHRFTGKLGVRSLDLRCWLSTVPRRRTLAISLVKIPCGLYNVTLNYSTFVSL